jgi:signal transduction histidine kinase
MDAGQIKLHKERLNLNKLITRVIDEHQTSVREKSQTLTFEAFDQAIYLRADNQYLHMALDNLINNASKYTPANGEIRVSLRKENHSVVIAVSDTGVGIQKDEIDAIFDKFTRGSNKLTSEVNGSGIGLYLVKQIARLHKGTVNVESNKPRGTTFSITLPTIIKTMR